jgi:hypothetical protein
MSDYGGQRLLQCCIEGDLWVLRCGVGGGEAIYLIGMQCFYTGAYLVYRHEQWDGTYIKKILLFISKLSEFLFL